MTDVAGERSLDSDNLAPFVFVACFFQDSKSFHENFLGKDEFS